ncbi:MAG TPA: peptide chain release factor N(5)-glutamine methyltransferase, partial [Chromatiales bacterium]|nr:peptide chain release factor N(5)-glutamine methyltransferase [Chromatiales bacterium]HEX22650.1 peptide chain release factor N(5)-glutamine methyltransferase [Chromatiales bacterium]
MTVETTLQQASRKLATAAETPRLEAEILLAHTLR